MQLQLMVSAKERVQSENDFPGGSKSTTTREVSSLMPSCAFMMDVMTLCGADCVVHMHKLHQTVALTCTAVIPYICY